MDEIEPVAKEKRQKGTRQGFVVTDGDVRMLKLIHDYRLLRIEQMEALTGRTYTRVHRRLKGLFDLGYIRRTEHPQKKDIYYIVPSGRCLLLARGLITDEEAGKRSRERELKPNTLDHEMMVADFHVALELAAQQGPIRLRTWKEGEEITDRFERPDGRTVNIRPDAFFQLTDTRLPDGSNTRSFLFEADRSTMLIKSREGSQRFHDKIERYRLFLESGRPFERYGVRSIRILTLTLTRDRRDNLCADTEKFLIGNNLMKLGKFFLFGSLTDLPLPKAVAILDALFRRPGEAQPYPLFPGIAETAARA